MTVTTQRRTVKADVKRARIVDAAAHVVGRDGYAKASIKAIAQEAGIMPGLIHYYFESKEILFLNVVELLDKQLVQEWRVAATHVSDPLERVVTLLRAVATQAEEKPELSRLVIDLYSQCLGDTTMRRWLKEVRGGVLLVLEEELRAVLGQLPAYTITSPRHLAETIVDAIDGIRLGTLVGESSPAAAFQTLTTLILSLVVTAYVAAGQEPPLERLALLAMKAKQTSS